MSPAALLDELAAAGVRVSRDGDDLIAEARPGTILDPYRVGIRQNKPALLTELRLREQIIAALNVEPRDFDRETYERLTAAYAAHERSIA